MVFAGHTPTRILLAAVLFLCSSSPARAQSSASELFNPAALLIVFREILEASIIISVLLNALTKVGADDKKRYVWLGAGLGLCVSLILSIAFVASFYAASNNVFSGNSKGIFQAVLSAVAAVMVTLVAFKMLKFSGLEAKWEAKLKSRGAKIIEGGGPDPQSLSAELSEEEKEELTGGKWKIFFLIFTTVVREGVETAVFIGGVGSSNWRSLPLPAFVGVVIGIVVAFLVLRGGQNVKSIKWFFYASCAFLLFVAAGFTNYAASEIESLYVEQAAKNGDKYVGVPLWDLTECCDENLSGFFSIFRALLGFRSKPTLIMALVYLGYWVVVIVMAWYKTATGVLWQSKVAGSGNKARVLPTHMDDVTHPAQAKLDQDSPGASMLSIMPQSAPLVGSIEASGAAFGDGSAAADNPDFAYQKHLSENNGPFGYAPYPQGPDVAIVKDEKANGDTVIYVGDAVSNVPSDNDSNSKGSSEDSKTKGASGCGGTSLRTHLGFAALLAMILGFIIAVCVVAGLRAQRTHVYWIAAEEVVWDFAPTGVNGVTGKPFTDPSEVDAALYTVKTDKYLGSKLKKVRYVEYTDNSFTVRKPAQPEWEHAGIMGPIIRCEVGDHVRVVFKNKDTQRPYSINVRGLWYNKANEGVKYYDGLRRHMDSAQHEHGRHLLQENAGVLSSDGRGPDQMDDYVMPGDTYVYRWDVPENAGPASGDVNSVAWTYQSMADGEFDLFTGLIGMVIVNARGATGTGGRPKGIDREVVSFFVVYNEEESHKRDANIAELTPNCADTCHYDDETVFESQQKRAVNGYIYDNVPNMVMKVGERVRWYVVAMGNEVDLHAAHWHDATMVHHEHRKTTLEMMAGSVTSVDMTPDSEGKHYIECSVAEHYAGGMVASYTVLPPDVAAPALISSGTTRHYYIAVEEVVWDYAPTGADTVTFLMPGMVDMAVAAEASSEFMATRAYTKAQFIEYTDDTFTEKKPVQAEWEHKGILGPIVRASVGDQVVVTLHNRASMPVSFAPSGLLVQKGYETPEDGVVSGDTHIYKFSVPERAGPGAGDGSSVAWLYVSDVRQSADPNAGLVGAVIVTRQGEAVTSSGRPRDVDVEFVALFSIFDEANSWLGTGGEGEAGRKHAINGFIYGNNDKFTARQGQNVRWYLLSLGDQVGLHTAHFHAQTVKKYSMRTDVIELLPTSAISVDMKPDEPGIWMLHCHVSAHMHNGMMTVYTVSPDEAFSKEIKGGQVREYFVACEEEVWDYGPSGLNGLTQKRFNESNAGVYMDQSPTRIGSKNIKARYVEYTDAKFATKKPTPAEWEHKGILGPVMRAEVGDQIKVTFLNKCSRPYSMHPHGVEYKKASEGVSYIDDVISEMKMAPAGVAPGTSFVYKWDIAERSGPGDGDGSSVPWLYHSHVNEGKDVTSGLIGMILISRKGAGPGAGKGEMVGRPYDVDREMVLFMKVFNEAESWYLNENIAKFTDGQAAITKRCEDDKEEVDEVGGCEGFDESNMKHAMNGYMFDNNPNMKMRQGERVRWYLLNLGSEVDMHGVIWNGNNVVQSNVRKDQIALMPASMLAVDMNPSAKGKWMVKCQVTDHSLAGMMSSYRVE